MKEHRMQAFCKYCRTITTPAPSHTGHARLCQNCLRPYEPAAALLADVVPQGTRTSLPMWASAPQEPAAYEHAILPGTPTGADPLCPYLRDWQNEQTVHLTPQKHNACYARLRQPDHWWSPSPWVVSLPTPVALPYQAGYCFATYRRCAAFRPHGTPAPQTPERALTPPQPAKA